LIELETVTVYRGDTDRKGNPNKSANGTVGVVFAWGGVSQSMGRFDRQESAEFSPEVYAPLGVDLRARDRIQRANGERYAVVGHGCWDQPGGVEVFGSRWVSFQVEAVNG
jgi:hypothetical protein